MWRHALDADPPYIDPADLSWSRGNDMWTPATILDETLVAPIDIIKLIRCSCSTDVLGGGGEQCEG